MSSQDFQFPPKRKTNNLQKYAPRRPVGQGGLIARRQIGVQPWARLGNKIIVAISLPFVLVARIIGIPLMFIDLLTFRLLTAPLRLILALIFNLVLWSSGLWTRTPSSRPALIIIQPLLISLTMVLIALTPQESDIRDTQNILCELWPLSRRRLDWIAERGSGKAEAQDQL